MNPARIQFAAVIALVTTASALPAHANLIQNGSFEEPVLLIGEARAFAGGSHALTGWDVVGDSVIVATDGVGVSSVTFNAQDGSQTVNLAGLGTSSKSNGVSQSFASSIGTAYEIKFYVASYILGFLFTSAVDLSINGGPRTSYFDTDIFAAGGSGRLTWKPYTVDFVATSTTTSLTFFNGSESDIPIAGLDNVSVEAITAPVPEPSGYALMLIGLAAIGGGQRVRQNAARARSRS